MYMKSMNKIDKIQEEMTEIQHSFMHGGVHVMREHKRDFLPFAFKTSSSALHFVEA